MTMSPALAAETLIAGAFLAWAVSPLSSAPEPLSNGIEFLTELVYLLLQGLQFRAQCVELGMPVRGGSMVRADGGTWLVLTTPASVIPNVGASVISEQAAVGDPRCGNDLLPAALLLTRPAGQQTNQSFRMLGHGGQFVVAITDRGNVEHPFGSRPQLTDGLGPAQDQGCQQAVPRCVESIGLIQHVAVALHGATV